MNTPVLSAASTAAQLRLCWDLTWALLVLAGGGLVWWLLAMNVLSLVHPERYVGRRAAAAPTLLAASIVLLVLILVVPT
jgi:hypothetical protein